MRTMRESSLNVGSVRPSIATLDAKQWAKVLWAMHSPWKPGRVPVLHVVALAVFRLGIWYATLVAVVGALDAILALRLHTLVLVGIADLTWSPPVWAALLLAPATLVCGLYLIGLTRANVLAQSAGALLLFFNVMLALESTLPTLAELVTFAGPTTQSTRTMRFEWAYKIRGKGASSYFVVVNPFHCTECRAPSMRASEALYDEVETTMEDAPPSPLFPDYKLKRYTQCITLHTERAGLAERAWLPHAGALDTVDTHACPPGAE